MPNPKLIGLLAFTIVLAIALSGCEKNPTVRDWQLREDLFFRCLDKMGTTPTTASDDERGDIVSACAVAAEQLSWRPVK